MTSAGAEYSAPIMDALGRLEAAQILRWRQTAFDLAIELDEITAERDGLTEQIAELMTERDKALAVVVAAQQWRMANDRFGLPRTWDQIGAEIKAKEALAAAVDLYDGVPLDPFKVELE